MLIFPAIDIRNGNYVRLEKGDFEQEIVFGDDPLDMALALTRRGARYLHVIDLDGAKGEGQDNEAIITSIARETGVPIQTGGGIRSFEKIERLLAGGASRVILGTAAFEKPEFLQEACCRFPDKVAVSIDTKEGMIATHGWKNVTPIRDTDYVKQIEDWGVAAVIYTDIARDGTLEGINFDALLNIKAATSIPVIASGGVSTMQDVKDCIKHDIYGVIIGMAIYSGNIPIEQLQDYF